MVVNSSIDRDPVLGVACALALNDRNDKQFACHFTHVAATG
jgi:hypothetical protein